MNDREIERVRKPRNDYSTPDVVDYLDEIVAQAPRMSAQARAKLTSLLGPSARRSV